MIIKDLSVIVFGDIVRLASLCQKPYDIGHISWNLRILRPGTNFGLLGWHDGRLIYIYSILNL